MMTRSFGHRVGDLRAFRAIERKRYNTDEVYGYVVSAGRPIHIPLEAVEGVKYG
jgi:hypothetical protein